MCEYLSFTVSRYVEGTALQVYVFTPYEHNDIEEAHSLRPGQYREVEWTSDDASGLVVRVEEGEDEEIYRNSILTQWPTRAALIAEHVSGRRTTPRGDRIGYRGGYAHGLWVYASGSRGHYRDGQRHGLWIFASGLRGHYRDGQQHGLWIFPDGSREHYRNGQAHGLWVYADGKREHYRDGRLVR